MFLKFFNLLNVFFYFLIIYKKINLINYSLFIKLSSHGAQTFKDKNNWNMWNK